PPTSTLFPYTTLFRSPRQEANPQLHRPRRHRSHRLLHRPRRAARQTIRPPGSHDSRKNPAGGGLTEVLFCLLIQNISSIEIGNGDRKSTRLNSSHVEI